MSDLSPLSGAKRTLCARSEYFAFRPTAALADAVRLSSSSFSSSNELLRRLLRVDPFFRTRQLNRHIRNPNVEGLPVQSPAMIR